MIICEQCSSETVAKKVAKRHSLRGKLYIVENVEAEVCPNCGERYYQARTLDAVDAILSRQHPVERTIEVEVVRL